MAKKEETTLLVKLLTKSFLPFWPPLYDSRREFQTWDWDFKAFFGIPLSANSKSWDKCPLDWPKYEVFAQTLCHKSFPYSTFLFILNIFCSLWIQIQKVDDIFSSSDFFQVWHDFPCHIQIHFGLQSNTIENLIWTLKLAKCILSCYQSTIHILVLSQWHDPN